VHINAPPACLCQQTVPCSPTQRHHTTPAALPLLLPGTLLQELGACDQAWALQFGFCQASCGRCERLVDPCRDVVPPSAASCEETLKAGMCTDPFLVKGGFHRTAVADLLCLE
jgi:hypothetical protein